MGTCLANIYNYWAILVIITLKQAVALEVQCGFPFLYVGMDGQAIIDSQPTEQS